MRLRFWRRSLTKEARALLKSVDTGGVPGFITANLLRIADENDVPYETDVTPNQIVEALRGKS